MEKNNTMMRKLFKLLLLFTISLILVGCGAENKQKSLLLSPESARTQMLQLIEPRLSWAVNNNNYFVQNFDANWKVVQSGTIDTYGQARQVYLFAKAYEITKEYRYLNAMVRSADLMLMVMFDSTNALWHSRIDRFDTEKRYGPDDYNTSFAIFSMAHAFRVSNDKRYLDAALKTWMVGDVPVGLNFAREFEKGSFFKGFGGVWSTNPLMHLFEALLALHDVTQSPGVWEDVEFIALFVEKKLIQQQGYLAEYYFNVDEPLPIADGGYVELGHQVEWAFLLHSAVDRGLDSRYRNIANDLFIYAMKTGWNDSDGSLASRSDYEGTLTAVEPVWWAQAELARYLISQARTQDKKLHHKILFSKIMAHIINHHLDQNNGGWFEGSKKNLPIYKLNKVIGYHSVAMYVEAFSFSGRSELRIDLP